MNQEKEKWYQARRKITNVLKLIGHLITLNDGGDFKQRFTETYLPLLILKKENIINNKGSFLDFFVKIENNYFLQLAL